MANNPKPSQQRTNKSEIINESLVDLRRVYDHICTNYDQLRVKALALIVAETAIISFIFSNGNTDDFGMPAEPDRRIFFFTALVFFGIAFGILLWIISTVGWKIPHDVVDADELVKRYHNKDEYLEHVHSDYVKDVKHNISATAPKFKRFNWAVYLLSAAVIIILVIKYGGHRHDQSHDYKLNLRHGNSIVIKSE